MELVCEEARDEGKHKKVTYARSSCHNHVRQKVHWFALTGGQIHVSCTLDSFGSKHDGRVEGDNPQVENELQEEFHVVEADTVGHKAAVMVHSEDASATLGAVMGPWWLYTLAPVAVVQELLPQVVNLVVFDRETIGTVRAKEKHIYGYLFI